jgi:hypothetical protein
MTRPLERIGRPDRPADTLLERGRATRVAAGSRAAAGLTAWADTWQADVFAVPSIVDEEAVWAATLEATAGHRGEALRVLVREADALLVDLAIQSGFAMTDELSGSAWMEADQRPPVAQVDGFAIVDRVTRADRRHPMIGRNGELVEPRLRLCSLYDPTLDLALLTNGLDRLARKGARRLKVGFETDAARNLYLGAGFVQTSIDRLLIRPAPQQQCGVGATGRTASGGDAAC